MIFFILDINTKYGVSAKTLINYKYARALVILAVAVVFAGVDQLRVFSLTVLDRTIDISIIFTRNENFSSS